MGAPTCDAATVADFDTLLMLRVREGDRASFDELVRTHRSGVIQYLYRTVRDPATAEDLAQDVFLRVYRSRNSYVPIAKFHTWLYRVATNVALNWIRDQRAERSHTAHPDSDDDSGRKYEIRDHRPGAQAVLLRNERAARIRAAVFALPERQRAAVLLHKYQGLDYADIARTLRCSVPAVKSLVFRAYEQLRRQLAEFEGR